MAKIDPDRKHLIDTLIEQGLTRKQAEAEADALDGSRDQLLVTGKDGKTKPAAPVKSILED